MDHESNGAGNLLAGSRLIVAMLGLFALGCADSAESPTLAEFAGPKAGYKYTYERRVAGSSQSERTTVAAVQGPTPNSIFTCSPASTQDYPRDLQSLGARPVVALVETEDDELVSVTGGRRTVLIRKPIAEAAAGWEHRQTVNMPDGTRRTNDFQCAISRVERRTVLDQDHLVATVECSAHSGNDVLVRSTSFASGVGPVAEVQEVRDASGHSVNSVSQVLVRRDVGAEDCQRVVAALKIK